ncbi:prevent-host-death protein [Pseudoclavibacter sp. AY1F1]|uniref:prevent-host-death protein n=1 Tax=Pseudoclavibacter sp. AY1F1 TaxID=2080583 RepID=UPI002157D263|nr:prevent-host-death protein [Pseudoclavibacter sp. AY1F1]
MSPYSELLLKYYPPTPISSQARTFNSSDLSRNATKVFAAAEDHPVDVTRRDGEDLVLMSKRESHARDQLLEIAARLIAAATDERGSLEHRMSQMFPWMLPLSPDGQRECAQDLLDASRASFSTGQAHLAIAELTAWKETASALAAGGGADPRSG